ncbi:MAG: ParB/RepB/Spo0J family partition protein [Erysipelotrichaceae bacterium]|nr:ParB/RepB/Spo0J family partition protein [Erysipelotrichaceae bacterium]
MAKKKALGKGLDQIFGENIGDIIEDISANTDKSSAKSLPIKQIRPNPYQPRKKFDEAALNELAESIKENGVFQPILVRKSLSGYELVAGERRLRASKIAGKSDIPAIIVDFDDKQMMEISLLENIQREDLSIIEVAEAYDQLISKMGYTQEELSARMNKSRSNITNILRLLNLPDSIKEMVNEGKLTYGHARALLSLDDTSKMEELAKKTVKEGLSVRELEKSVKKKDTPKKKENEKDPYVKDVENRLIRKFSTKVEISGKNITISYNSVDDLNRILEIMGAIEE